MLRRRVATPRGDYLATVMAVAGLVESAEHELGRRGSVGVGIPGAESRVTGFVKNANSTWLIGQPLRRDLQALLHRPVRIDNDANCFALSEATDGAAAGAVAAVGIADCCGRAEVVGGTFANATPMDRNTNSSQPINFFMAVPTPREELQST